MSEQSISNTIANVHLLDDLPAKQDAFGPHKRIAESIRQMVTTESGGKAIALIGTWGGGKSTVINLLKSSDTRNLEVFIFDAWTHQGDPLKRTFLEKLITFLAAPGRQWISPKEWKKRLGGKYSGQIDSRLLREAQNISTWPQLDEASGRGIAALLKQAKDENVSKGLLSSISGSSPILGKAQVGADEISQWITGVAEVLNGLIALGHENLILEGFSICSKPDEYLAVLVNATSACKRNLWRYFRPGCNTHEILKLLPGISHMIS